MTWAKRLLVQSIFEVARQRKYIYRLFGEDSFFCLAKLAQTSSLANLNPVICLVTSSQKPLSIDKGFYQMDWMMIQLLPVFR